MMNLGKERKELFSNPLVTGDRSARAAPSLFMHTSTPFLFRDHAYDFFFEKDTQ
jgi:hypothetical protein